jgi:hypothetical protein
MSLRGVIPVWGQGRRAGKPNSICRWALGAGPLVDLYSTVAKVLAGWWTLVVESGGRGTRRLGVALRLACFDCLRCSTRDLAKIVYVLYVLYVLYCTM